MIRVGVLAALLVLTALAWTFWSRPSAFLADLAARTSVPQTDTFPTPHRAVLSVGRQARPSPVLQLNLHLANPGPNRISFMVGPCDFHYAVVRRRDLHVVAQNDPNLGCLLVGLSHDVPVGGRENVAGILVPIGAPTDPQLRPDRYVAFGALRTSEGIIVAPPLAFQITRQGDIVPEP